MSDRWKWGKDKFGNDIRMEESPLIRKIFHESRSAIIDTTKVSQFIDKTKTWNISKLNEVLPNYIVDKI